MSRAKYEQLRSRAEDQAKIGGDSQAATALAILALAEAVTNAGAGGSDIAGAIEGLAAVTGRAAL